jgi:hypothetical protein
MSNLSRFHSKVQLAIQLDSRALTRDSFRSYSRSTTKVHQNHVSIFSHNRTSLHSYSRATAELLVRPFVKTNKTDAADAQAIWTAAEQPEMRSVAVKTEEQQAVLALHDIRTRLQRSRSAAINQLHGVMGEFGVELPRGWRTMLPQAPTALDSASSPVPPLLHLSEALESHTKRVGLSPHQRDLRLIDE